jgi:hypothetical protein
LSAVDVASYFGTAAQVIPVAFVVVSFELNSTLKVRPVRLRPRAVEALPPVSVTWLAQSLSAIIGEATALHAVYANHAVQRDYYVVGICLGALAVTMLALPVAVGFVNASSRAIESITDTDARDRRADVIRARELAAFARSCDDGSLAGQRLAVLALRQADAKYKAVNAHDAASRARLRTVSRHLTLAGTAEWLASTSAIVTPLFWLATASWF